MSDHVLINVKRYTRAEKYGSTIICPECDKLSVVHNFAWKTRVCPHCGEIVEKYSWLMQPKIKSKPRQCNLCGRHTIYRTKIEHPYYRDPGECFWCGFVQDEWELIESLTTPVSLQCPGSVSFGERCQHLTVFAPENFTNRYMYSFYGETPYYYPDLTGRCPACGYLNNAKDFVMNNMDVFRNTHEKQSV